MRKPKKIDKWVYKRTKKPNHYVEVKNPPITDKEKKERPQDARQVQYNNWSKHFKRYSGSYLPKDDKKLLKQGWVDITHPQSTATSRDFSRKSTGQLVRHDYNRGKNDVESNKYGRHWHWFNRWGASLKGIKNEEYPYYDKYGNPCKEGNKNSPHHIGEEGEEFIPWQKK